MLYAATDNPTCCNEDGRSRMLQLRPGIDKKKKKKRRVGSAGWGWGSSPKWQHHNYYTDPSLWIWNQRLRLECNCGQVNCLWTSCWNFLNDNFLIWKWRKYILHVVAIRTTQKKNVCEIAWKSASCYCHFITKLAWLGKKDKACWKNPDWFQATQNKN